MSATWNNTYWKCKQRGYKNKYIKYEKGKTTSTGEVSGSHGGEYDGDLSSGMLNRVVS
jgi:hypothetical protein